MVQHTVKSHNKFSAPKSQQRRVQKPQFTVFTPSFYFIHIQELTKTGEVSIRNIKSLEKFNLDNFTMSVQEKCSFHHTQRGRKIWRVSTSVRWRYWTIFYLLPNLLLLSCSVFNFQFRSTNTQMQMQKLIPKPFGIISTITNLIPFGSLRNFS